MYSRLKMWLLLKNLVGFNRDYLRTLHELTCEEWIGLILVFKNQEEPEENLKIIALWFVEKYFAFIKMESLRITRGDNQEITSELLNEMSDYMVEGAFDDRSLENSALNFTEKYIRKGPSF